MCLWTDTSSRSAEQTARCHVQVLDWPGSRWDHSLPFMTLRPLISYILREARGPVGPAKMRDLSSLVFETASHPSVEVKCLGCSLNGAR